MGVRRLFLNVSWIFQPVYKGLRADTVLAGQIVSVLRNRLLAKEELWFIEGLTLNGKN
jgi:hypothetical protein